MRWRQTLSGYHPWHGNKHTGPKRRDHSNQHREHLFPYREWASQYPCSSRTIISVSDRQPFSNSCVSGCIGSVTHQKSTKSRRYPEVMPAMICLRTWLIPAALLSSSFCTAQTTTSTSQHLPSAESVMNRVAINQDTAEAERVRYVYVQHAKMTSRHGKT